MNNCRAGKGRAGRDVLPAQQVGLKCQSLLTGHHVGHYSALGQVVGDIRKKKKNTVSLALLVFFCENVSLRTSCERVHTNPTVLDAAKKVPHRDAIRPSKPSGFCRAGSQGTSLQPNRPGPLCGEGTTINDR